MQEEESNPTIHIVSPTQSHGRSTPPSPVREHTDSAADISNTKVRSVTAQLGGLSLQVSSQRSSALHVQSDSNPGPKSAATSIAINPSLSPVSYTLAGQPLNPYPSPQSTLRLSLDRASEFVQGSSTSSMTSSQESHVPGPSITSILTNDSGSQSMHTVEKNKTKKFQVFGALGFKKKKAERKL
ncbi:hypothetical protein BDZ97DRAFT_1842688 [Flammula alnicola]|nr:hypothetical protein BDZ97DRAFT_1842688 [Flammula alnicola]